MTRVSPVVFAVASLFGFHEPPAAQSVFGLQVVPEAVFKVDDPGGARTSSFVFNVAAICNSDCELGPASARVELLHVGSIVERQDWTADMLAKIKGVSYRVGPNTPVQSPTHEFTLPEAFDLRFYFRTSQSLAIDSAVVHLTVVDAKNRRSEQTIGLPIRYYRQKTTLILPFRGLGVVGQDYITNGGHGGFWNAFALDLRGLENNGAAQLRDGNDNESDAGWGREIIAPAAGTVVYARNDVPTNPRPGAAPDSTWYRTLHDPVMADAGNCVIIDHGNSEYSVMMHMQTGSVTVHVGDRVSAGQVVGKLGNSGDAFGPHLHYQLQSGPRLFQYQSLPVRFESISAPQLSKGTFFSTP